jgi:hypothetical protein
MARCMFPRLGGKYLRSEASCQAGASSAIEEIAPPNGSCFGRDRESCHSTELLSGEESVWVLRNRNCPCRPERQN